MARAPDPTHIRHDGRKLDVGILEHDLHAIGASGALFDEMDAVAREVAQLSLRGGGDEAPTHQPVAQQLGQPLGVLDIGLAPRHRLDVGGVDDEQLDLALQQIVDRTPKCGSALHDHMGALLRCQPVAQGEELVGHGAEGADLFVDAPLSAGS
jgi:hypothetical protein